MAKKKKGSRKRSKKLDRKMEATRESGFNSQEILNSLLRTQPETSRTIEPQSDSDYVDPDDLEEGFEEEEEEDEEYEEYPEDEEKIYPEDVLPKLQEKESVASEDYRSEYISSLEKMADKIEEVINLGEFPEEQIIPAMQLFSQIKREIYDTYSVDPIKDALESHLQYIEDYIEEKLDADKVKIQGLEDWAIRITESVNKLIGNGQQNANTRPVQR